MATIGKGENCKKYLRLIGREVHGRGGRIAEGTTRSFKYPGELRKEETKMVR